MAKKKAFDHDRQELEPPRLLEPYMIKRDSIGIFLLMRNDKLIQALHAKSEDGAYREAALIINGWDF